MSVDTKGTEECFEVSKRKIFCLNVYIQIFKEHCNYIFLKLYFKKPSKIVSKTDHLYHSPFFVSVNEILYKFQTSF